jgi:predicted nucleic acid-binding protein
MTGLVFVDTNVPACVRDPRDPAKSIRAADWLRHLWRTGAGRTSYQVLAEFYRVTTKKFRPGLAVEVARVDIRRLTEWNPVTPSPSLFEQAWALHGRYSLQWFDSLIVAAAQESGCRYLLSEDFQHGQSFGGVHVVNPFRATPEELP